MNEVINNILERRSIRKYKSEQIKENDLEMILQTGLYAPSAGSRQSTIMVVCQDKEVLQQLGAINKSLFAPKNASQNNYVSKEQPSIADDTNINSGFYNAPTVVIIFAPHDMRYSPMDASVVAENMMLAANSIGIGSCFVGRAEETFQHEYAQSLLQKWGIAEGYEAKVFVSLGFPDSTPSTNKPRKDGRILRA